MKDNNVNRVVLLASFLIFAIAMVFVTYFITIYNDGSGKYFKNYNKNVKNELAITLKEQEVIDEKIKDASKNGNYTIDSPCVIENPYGLNPLSAIIIFNTTENRKVNVKINDMQVTKMEASKKHIIPIYGLYANSTNFIELELDDKTTKTVEIVTTSYNDNLTGINFSENKTKGTHKFVLGNLKSSNSILRGFDSYDKLVFYIDFGYIGGIRHNMNKFYIAYNSTYSKNTKLEDLNLEIDNLGRVLSVSTDTSELEYNYTAESGDKIYHHVYKDLYEKTTSNYTMNKRVDNTAYSIATTMRTKDIETNLVKADIYEKDYKIGINGEYITYEFDEDYKNTRLILVTRNTDYTYSYLLDGKNTIKTNAFGDVALYLKIADKYYSLLTTIDN